MNINEVEGFPQQNKMGSHPGLWQFAVFLLLWPLSLGQQCPAGSIVTVSASCRRLEAASPPQGGQVVASPPPLVTTSSGLFDWWYTVPNLVVATTQSQPFPRGIINNATNILVQQKYLKNADFESFQPSYLPWSTPIILVACAGVLIGLLFLLVGCCLCLCSCLCKHRKETAYRPKLVARQNFRWCIWWNSISVVSGVFLLFGFVMACACVITFNEATYSLPPALQQSTSTIVAYLNTTKQEFGSQLNSGLEQTADCINGQVNDIPAAVGEAVLSTFELGDHTDSVAMDCLEVLSITEKTNASAQVLLQHLQDLVAELGAVFQLSTELLLNCTAHGPANRCNALQEVIDSLTINPMQLPNLTGNASVLQNYLTMELKPSLDQVRNILANTSAVLATTVSSQIEDTVETTELNLLKAQSQNKSVSFADIVDDASQLMMDVVGCLESLLTATPSSLTSDAPDQSTLALVISVYNYGYLIGVFFCVLFGLVLVALAICLILGCLAYERIPQTRDRKAQHMKRCFRLLTFCIFIVAFVSIALASFGYFVGANIHEVCEELRGPEYSALNQTLDDPQWRQSNLLQMLRSTSSQAFFQPILASNVSASVVLSQCFSGATSWQVFDLEDILNSTSDLSLSFIGEEFSSSIESQQSSLASAVPTALSALSDPVTDLASAVDAISQLNAVQPSLEYGQFLASVETVLAAARSVQGQVGNLSALLSALNNSNQPLLREGLGVFIQQIEGIDGLVAGVEGEVVQLMNLSVSFPVVSTRMQASLDSLSSSSNMFLTDLNNDTAMPLMSAMKAVMCGVEQAGNYSRAAEQLVYYNTSSCYPLWEAYSTAYTATCVNLLGSLNGLWFAMGWCVLGLIPLLVGLLGVQSLFVRARLPDRRSTSNVTAHLTKNKPVALVSHSARQQTIERQLVGIELDVVENAWTGEVIQIPVSQSENNTEAEYNVNANLNVPPDSRADGGVGHSGQRLVTVDVHGENTQTLPWAEVHQNENTLISQPPPSYEQLI